MSCIQNIKSEYFNLTRQHRVLADYVQDHALEVIYLTAQDVADRTNTSASAVVRFSRALGYKGFTALKLDLAQDIYSNDENTEILFNHKDSPAILSSKVVNSLKNILDSTMSLVNPTLIEESIEKLKEANTIYIIGVGSASMIGIDLFYKLIHLGKKIFFHENTYLQDAALENAQSSDVAIVISYTGLNKEVNQLAQKAYKKGVCIISITSSKSGPLNKMSQISLPIPSKEPSNSISTVASKVSILALIDILYLGMKQNESSIDNTFIESTQEFINEL